MIVAEKRHADPKISVVKRSGVVTRDDKQHETINSSNDLNARKQIEGLWINKIVQRQPTFDPQVEKEIFMEPRERLQDLGASTSRVPL